MSTLHSLDTLLTETTPRLTEAESARLLVQIEAATTSAPNPIIPSPYTFMFTTFKPMTFIALTLILLLGAGGTVAASGSAKPGDLLFPIDRATEEVRLALASGDQKAALQNQFITERFAELKAIVDEEKVAPTSTATSTETLVRASGEARVANAVAVLASQLASETDGAKREEFLKALLDQVSAVHVVGRDNAPLQLDAARVKIDDTRTEVETPNERVRIEQKDGKVEIRVDNRGHRGSDDAGVPNVSSSSTSATTSQSRHESETNENEIESNDASHHESEEHVVRASSTPSFVPSTRAREERGGEGDDGRHGGNRGESEGGHDD